MEAFSSNSFVQMDRPMKISIPSPEQDRMIAVRDFDWQRIKGRVSRISKKEVSLSIWYPSLFGIAITSGLSIWPVSMTKDLPAWVTPSYVICTVTFLAMGGILMWLDRKVATNKIMDVDEIMADMEKVESLFSDNHEEEGQKG